MSQIARLTCLIVVVFVVLEVSGFNPAAAATFDISPSTSSIEPGDTITFTVSLAGAGLCNVSTYQAQLALPAGMSVPDNADIHEGNFFVGTHSTGKNYTVPYLTASSWVPPWYETHDSAVLASFDVLIDSGIDTGLYTVSTTGTFLLDNFLQYIPDIRHDSAIVEVGTPLMEMSSWEVKFADTIIGSSKTEQIDISNSGPAGTVLNGQVFPAELLTFNNAPAGATPNPFSLILPGGVDSFDLAGETGDKYSFSVEFAPVLEGYYTGRFDIVSDNGTGGASNTTTSIYLFGQGVPEPASLTVLAIGAALIMLRRRFR